MTRIWSEAVAERLYLVKDGGVSAYDGDLQAYRGLIMEQRRQERADARKNKKAKQADPVETSPPAAAKGDPKKAAKLEAQLEKLLQQKTDLEAALSAPEALADEPLLQKILADYAAVEKQVDELETAWIEAQT